MTTLSDVPLSLLDGSEWRKVCPKQWEQFRETLTIVREGYFLYDDGRVEGINHVPQAGAKCEWWCRCDSLDGRGGLFHWGGPFGTNKWRCLDLWRRVTE